MKKIIIAQFVILLSGTLFAWCNFSWELYGWLNARGCVTGCLAGPNPFITPCFFGALFFTVAFVLSAKLIRKI